MHEVGDEHTFERILSRNDEIAEHNREHLNESGVLGVNLMSAPGAGKTTLLAASIPALDVNKCLVIEGDMVGELDAERLRKKGVKAFQISTGRSCHLDANMVARVLHHEPIAKSTEYLFFENVGNLVCPAEFPLGEHVRVVLLSVTEGSDKPVKYPVIFRHCDAVIFTKSDLIPYVDFDLGMATESIRSINPDAQIFSLSTKSRQGLHEWLDWLRERRAQFIKQLAEQEHTHVHIHTG